jgi:uncharacterized protein (TIGR00369 family)
VNADFDELIQRWNAAPYLRWADIHLLEVRPGYARAEMRLHEPHRGGGGTRAVNGGIMAYFFDGILSAAARSVAQEGFQAMSTVNLNIQYMDLLQASEKVIGEASVLRAGKGTVFAEARLFDDEGKVCTLCTGVIRLFYKRQGT